MIKEMYRRYHKDGTLPSDEEEIFVFGANTAGRHGAGAAAIARHLGAKYRVGRGRSGRTYAIPTKDGNLKTLPLPVVIEGVNDFIQYTHDHPELSFFVTAVGCGLAGYKHEQIAPLFKAALNCSFPIDWFKYLEDYETKID